MRYLLGITLLIASAAPSVAGDLVPLDDLRRVFDAELRYDGHSEHALARFDVSGGAPSLELVTSMYDYVTLEVRRTRGRRLVLAGTCVGGGDVGADARARFVVRPVRARIARLDGSLRCGDRRSRVRLVAPLDAGPPVRGGTYVFELDDVQQPTTSVTVTLAVDDRGGGRLTGAVERDDAGALVATYDDAEVLITPSRIVRLWAPRDAVVDPAADQPDLLGLFGVLSTSQQGGGRFYVGSPPIIEREGAWRILSGPDP